MRERCRFQAHAELPIRAGFTLIEMSIVLVIIGLIVGAVLAGQSLILQAQMRATMKQIESYKTAVATFRDKYSCLPGDCATATSFWPKDPACTYQNLRPYIAAPNGMTCNGDGNGIIYGYYYNELMLFWQHLSLAGLIQGSFTGTCGYGPSDDCYSSVHYFDYRVNLDAPAAPIGSAGITLTYPLLQWPGDPRFNQTAMNGQHVFWMGAPGTTDGSGNSIISGYPQPMLTPKQAYALDTKYDDGSPFTGTIMEGFKRPWSLCDNNVSYFTTGTTGDTIECTVMFLGGF
jgi:prepilin-type N-terminal cleavage/methylation domain-containing protein